MKYLSHYIQDKQTALFKSTGAFFAFGNKQFEEQKVDSMKYTHMGSSGMICPSKNVGELLAGLEAIHADGIKQDIAENGIKKIIHRELGNHEAQITYEFQDTLDSLEGYDITEEMVKAEWSSFYKTCEDNGWT